MRIFSLKGYLAQRRAKKQLLRTHWEIPTKEEDKEKIEYICAHYTMMGLSFVIAFKGGKILQKKIDPTPQAVAELFKNLEG